MYGLCNIPSTTRWKKTPKRDPKNMQGQYLRKSVDHVSPVGLTKNLWTDFIPQQFHLVYNNYFQTVMGGLYNNEAIANLIWEGIFQENVDNIMDGAHQEHDPIPQLHTD